MTTFRSPKTLGYVPSGLREVHSFYQFKFSVFIFLLGILLHSTLLLHTNSINVLGLLRGLKVNLIRKNRGKSNLSIFFLFCVLIFSSSAASPSSPSPPPTQARWLKFFLECSLNSAVIEDFHSPFIFYLCFSISFPTSITVNIGGEFPVISSMRIHADCAMLP